MTPKSQGFGHRLPSIHTIKVSLLVPNIMKHFNIVGSRCNGTIANSQHGTIGHFNKRLAPGAMEHSNNTTGSRHNGTFHHLDLLEQRKVH